MGITVDIPGGTATFREALTTERQRRPIKRAALAASAVLAKLPDERPDDKTIQELLPSLPITRDEADRLLEMYDAIILAYLEGWTIDRPLPGCEDDLLDLPGDVYDALQNEASKLQTSDATADTDFSAGPEGSDAHRPTGSSPTSDSL